MNVEKLNEEQWGNNQYMLTDKLGRNIGIVSLHESGEWELYLYNVVPYGDEGKSTGINFYYKRFRGFDKTVDYAIDNYEILVTKYRDTGKKIIYRYQDLYGPRCDYYANEVDAKPIKHDKYKQLSLFEV